jgi:hypothetical protein
MLKDFTASFMTVYTLSELIWSTNMQEVYVGVHLVVPDSMTPAQACAEVKTSIGFGQPEVALLWFLPIPRIEPTSQ